MDCELPATGGAPMFVTALAAVIVLLITVSTLVLVRPRGVTSVLVVALMGAALGVAGGRDVEAATMCATGTAAPAPASSVAPSSSTLAGTTSTSPATLPGIEYGPNCYFVENDAGLREFNYLIEMTAGAGTYTAYLAFVSLQGCDGDALFSRPVVDSGFYDPDSYCSSVLPGSHPVNLLDDPWAEFKPPIPLSWFECVPGLNSEATTTSERPIMTEPTTTSEATTTTEATTTLVP